MEKVIKTLVVDDHDLVRTAIGYILADVEDIEVIDEAGNGHEAIKLTQELSPDVILLDLKLPDIDGLEVTQKILRKNSKTKILILTACDDDIYPSRLLDAGVSGYMTKNANEKELIEAIHKVYNNERYISPHVAQRLLLSGFHAAANNKLFDKLSDRELQVALMLTQGLLVVEIARQLNLTRKTINSHRYCIFEKLGVDNDVQLALLAVRNGIVPVMH